LDLDAVLWLESWLQNYRGTLLLISHDRDFLDAVADYILHIEQQTLALYRGNYSDFERQRAEKLAQQQSLYERQERQTEHLLKYIDRFRAQATKARQAQSRIKALERMELVSAAHVDSAFDFCFGELSNPPDPLLVLDDGAVGYGDTTMLKGLALTLRPNERLGLLGRNGAGKSTLIKLLAGELEIKFGKRITGKEIRIGYFAQHQLEQLRTEESPLQHMLRLAPNVREQEHRDYLGGFDFRGDMATTPCGGFSGGEKSRLALALLIWHKPNLLLLDEPTNHLDLEMRHALSMALQQYDGGVVLVSHDRALLRATCDRFLLVADGVAAPFDGDLEDYRAWLANQNKNQEKPTEKNLGKSDRALNKMERQARLAERRPLLKEVEKLEQQMAHWQKEKNDCDARLGNPDIYAAADKATLQTLLKRQAELNQMIETAETRWLEVHEQLETMHAI
jgi:ATP-binding cassette subfamily F protein 3